MNSARWVHGMWEALSLPAEVAFRRALRAPEHAQDRLLKQTVQQNANTRYGRRHRFADIRSRADFRRRVPLTRYQDYEADMAAVRLGERNVLTHEPVQRLVPSSGSTSAVKLIPHTHALGAQMQAAIAPWIVDVMRRYPSTRSGAAYWSVSPAFSLPTLPSAVPIGFDTDASYLGRWLAPLMERVLVVPEGLRHAQSLSGFQYASLRLLLSCENLRLISVWHPSFLELLWKQRKVHWDKLIDDIRYGTLSPPEALGPSAERCVSTRLRRNPQRALELSRLGPDCDLGSVWPKLSLISAWGDGAAAQVFQSLGKLGAHASLQPKGLLATEACVTIPYAGQYPLAVRSHFFEFLDESENVCELEALHEGCEYEVVVTTLGGLYRYRLGDRVRMEGKLGRTPSLRFVGRADSTVDLTGEKLCEAFVHSALSKAWAGERLPSFAMLAPDRSIDGHGYTLYVEGPVTRPFELLGRLESALCENPHFAYARGLGQLLPTRIYQATGSVTAEYIARLARDGARIGNIKACSLSRHDDWSVVLSGHYPAYHPPSYPPTQTSVQP